MHNVGRLVPRRSRGKRLRLSAWLLPPFVLVVAIGYPTISLLLGSLSDAPPGEPGRWTTANYIAVLSDPRFYRLVATSILVAASATILAVLSAFGLAWLTERTDIPFRRTIRGFAAAPFLIPASLSAIGWAVLGNPDAGLINQMFGAKIVNIYSYGGLVFALAQHAAGFVYLMLIGPLRNADPSLEEAARLSGASAWKCFRTIQLPLVWPIVLALALLTFVRAFEAFEVPVILGTPGNLFVVTNDIYYRLKTATPPQYGHAFALAVVVTITLGTLMWLQTRQAGRARIVTVTGKGFRPQRYRLQRWTVTCLILTCLYACLTSILPMGTIVFSSFSKIFGLYDSATFTFDNYRDVLTDPVVLRGIGNTLILMTLGATICVALGGLTAYALERRYRAAREAVTSVLLIPWSMPGIVFGLALLWAFIQVPGLYGSLFALLIACIIFGLPAAVMSVSSVLGQIGGDLEEAARVHGGSTLQTMRWVVLPLVMPGLIAGWFILAAIFSRELAAAVLLYGNGSEVVSVLILGFWEQGRGNYVAVLCIIMMAILVALQLTEPVAYRIAGNNAGKL